MIGALLAVLQGFPALPYLYAGLPLAVLLATLWTLFNLQTTVVEIRVAPGSAAFRTIWDCLCDAMPSWQPILEIRMAPRIVTVALGHASYELDRSEWPAADALVERLKEARDIATASAT